MTKVSIIIPIYNEAGVIEDCILSLQKQSYKDMEIIVVDDGSTDNSVEIVEHTNVKLLKGSHRGAGASRNLGIKHSVGDILIFVDADMTFDTNFVKNLIKPIIEEGVIGTFSKEEYLANKENPWARAWNINRGLPVNRMHTKDYPGAQEVFRAIKKDSFERVGGFDTKAGYTDDWSLSEKLGVKAVAAPGAIFYHKNPGTLSEVFIQSKWMAKRKYKLGLIGYLISLIRASFPFSVIVGILKSIQYSFWEFLLFKLVADAGAFFGILEYAVLGKVSK